MSFGLTSSVFGPLLYVKVLIQCKTKTPKYNNFYCVLRTMCLLLDFLADTKRLLIVVSIDGFF